MGGEDHTKRKTPKQVAKRGTGPHAAQHPEPLIKKSFSRLTGSGGKACDKIYSRIWDFCPLT
jgi:hypothetical protein